MIFITVMTNMKEIILVICTHVFILDEQKYGIKRL